MYRPTYNILKNCNQNPYGFKNLISSWGSWSKISKLQQVGDVIDFRSKSSLFIFTNTWEHCCFFFIYFFFRKWLYLEVSQKSGYTCIGYTPDFLKMVTIPNLVIPQKSGYTLLGYTLLMVILLFFPTETGNTYQKKISHHNSSFRIIN